VDGGCLKEKSRRLIVAEMERGWQLGQPDLIAQMPAMYTLPGEGGMFIEFRGAAAAG